MGYDEMSETDDETGDKIRHARQLFEEAVDHTRDAHSEAHRAIRFYHNTRLEGQWESEDLAYLRDEGRPAFSFNITKDKVDSFLGMYADAQRKPTIVGSGSEDKLLAEVVNIAVDQTLQATRYDRKSAGMLKTGTVAGECGMHVEVVPSKRGKDWIEINLYRIMPFEIHWDASSIEADRSDARHVFWDRWLSKSEFQEAYPEHKKEWSTLSSSGDSSDLFGSSSGYGEAGDGLGDALDDYDGDRHSQYYFDRQNRKVRVIRFEYLEFVQKTYVTHTESGERTEVDKEQLARVEMAMGMGEPYEIEEVKEEIVKVCEFIGPMVLAEFDSPGPFDGFSIVDYVYMMDEEEGTPYSLVRNLFDPQMELNKSKSLEIEYIAQMTAPGMLAEVGALVDEDQASEESRRPGGIVMVTKGSLSGGQVREKVVTPPSPAIIQRAAGAMDLMDRISGIPSSGLVQPSSQAEAATTVALRYHKSRQVVQDPISNFEFAQSEIVRRVVEAITRAMPDDQIQSLIANDAKYKVGNGMIVEMGPNPQKPDGPPVPVQRAALRDIRSLHHNIELEHSSENSTLRMMEFDMLMKMMQANVPVDPEVIVETSTGSRSQQERLKAYVEKAQRAQSESKQQESQMFDKQMQMAAQTEMQRNQETARHNQVTEQLQGQKNLSDANAKLAELWEKSDANEKDFFLDMLEKQQNQRKIGMGAQ